jgi:2-methylcitrate dehydratase
VAKALALDQPKTANALAICGTAFNALRVTRTGALSHWKGLAYPNTAFVCTQAAFLAMRGVTGPLEVFEGNKGFMEVIAGSFEIDWTREDLERVTRTIVKKYNAEIHSQSTLEGALELRQEHGIRADQIDRVEVETFDVAFHIIGGGEEGDKTRVQTKEQADHSLHYMIAVALLDGQVLPEQYAPDRIVREDVQSLLRRIEVRPSDAFSRRFPGLMPCRIRIALRDGRVLVKEKEDYEGFHTRRVRWETVRGKFERLGAAHTDVGLRSEIAAAVGALDGIQVRDLARLLGRVKRPG